MTMVDIIVLAAMEEEITPFLQRATAVSEPSRIGNAIHYRGVIHGRNALFVQGGIGLVNAAGAATAALLLANPDDQDAPPPLVISAGSAGGLGDSVRVGDVVIGTRTINADADARAFGYELGQVPGMPSQYAVPPYLLDACSGAARGQTGAAWDTRLVETVHLGLIVSSYSFVSTERAAVVKAQYDQVLATDMESSAIAQTCYSFKAPFLAIRGISDLCGPASESDFLVHVDDAAERSAEIAAAAIGAWIAAGTPRSPAA